MKLQTVKKKQSDSHTYLVFFLRGATSINASKLSGMQAHNKTNKIKTYRMEC
jgi:hypothetical protein